MNSSERREKILQMLTESESYITAAKLAQKFGVTRQIIVSDIALLRANGNKILAAKQGYVLERNKSTQLTETIICKHNAEQIIDEFYAVVDNGGCVLNVIVEHPIYGQLSADLNIASRYDAEQFVRQAKSNGASQLCDLTGGLHIHTIRFNKPEDYTRIVHQLTALEILYENSEKGAAKCEK